MIKSMSAYIIVDWRKYSQRLTLRKPLLKPYEVSFKINYQINKPDNPTPNFNIGELKIPQAVIDKVSAEMQNVEEKV